MDVVYILGSGSRWQNQELFYSLRSVKKYLTGYRNIYVIGEHPGFGGEFIHIPHPDRYDKDTNICDKVLRACNESAISSDFVFMNDDVFFLRQTDVKQIPDTYIGKLNERIHKVLSRDYSKVLANTYHVLRTANLPYKDFDGHMPIVYNKKLFSKAVSRYNWGVRHGYAVKSIYFNTLRIKGVFQPDLKINKPEHNIPALLRDRWCFSIGDNGLTAVMKNFIASSF